MSVCYAAGFFQGSTRRIVPDGKNEPAVGVVAKIDDGRNVEELSKAPIDPQSSARNGESDRIRLLEWLRTSKSSSVKGTHAIGGALYRDGVSLPSLIYIFVPKAGSSTMKMAFSKVNQTAGGKMIYKEMIRLNTKVVDMGDGRVGPLKMSQFYTFSLLRDPRQRIMSAYSTIMNRDRSGSIGTCRTQTIKLLSPQMPQDKNPELWRTHFVSSMAQWLGNVRSFGWNSTDDCLWNVHIIPQVEFLKGYDLKHIGCVESIDNTMELMNISDIDATSGSGDNGALRNHYEHNAAMPDEKFQSYDQLPERTKSLIEELYREDFELYDAFCGEISQNSTEDVARNIAMKCRAENQSGGSRCSFFTRR